MRLVAAIQHNYTIAQSQMMNIKDKETDIEEYIDHNVTKEEPIIFPIRRYQISDPEEVLGESVIYQLSLLLKCSLCQSRISEPAFLGCSHRFCRQCLMFYLKEKMKKYCPVCLTIWPIKVCRSDAKFDITIFNMIQLFNKVIPEKDELSSTSLSSKDQFKRQFPILIEQEGFRLTRKRFKNNNFYKKNHSQSKKAHRIKMNVKFDSEGSLIPTELSSTQKQSSVQIIKVKQISINSYQRLKKPGKLSSFENSLSIQTKLLEESYRLPSDLSLSKTFESKKDEIKQNTGSFSQKDHINRAFRHFNSRVQLPKGNCEINSINIDVDNQRDELKMAKIMLKRHPGDFLTPPLSFTSILLPETKTVSFIASLIAQELNLKQMVKLFVINTVTRKVKVLDPNYQISFLFSNEKIKFSASDENDLSSIINQFVSEEEQIKEEKSCGKIYYQVIRPI